MEQPPTEYLNPTISDVQLQKPTPGTRAMTFTMRTAGERFAVMMWNPQFVVPNESEWEPLSEERLNECFADCEVCQVFEPKTQRARMEFQKPDDHPMVKAARMEFKRLAG